jgi:hypothetical protein
MSFKISVIISTSHNGVPVRIIDGMNVEHVFGDHTSIEFSDWIAQILEKNNLARKTIAAKEVTKNANVTTAKQAARFFKNQIGKMYRPWDGPVDQLRKIYRFKRADRRTSLIGYTIVGPFVKYFVEDKEYSFTTENMPDPKTLQRYLDIFILWEYCFVLSQRVPFISLTCPLTGYPCVNDENESLCAIQRDLSNRTIESRRKHFFESHLGRVYLCLSNRCTLKYLKSEDLVNHYVTQHSLKKEVAEYIVEKDEWQNFYNQRWRGEMSTETLNINDLIKYNRRNIYGTIPIGENLYRINPEDPSLNRHHRNPKYRLPARTTSSTSKTHIEPRRKSGFVGRDYVTEFIEKADSRRLNKDETIDQDKYDFLDDDKLLNYGNMNAKYFKQYAMDQPENLKNFPINKKFV